MSLKHRTGLLLLATLALCHACSDFIMDNSYRLSARTMDFGTSIFKLRTLPVGSPLPSAAGGASAYGAVISVQEQTFTNASGYPIAEAGLNTQGLSCDLHALVNSSYPNKSNTPKDLDLFLFCTWALTNFKTAGDVKTALETGQVHLWSPAVQVGVHFVVRDSLGRGLVVEFIEGQTTLHQDNNDSGETGYGVFTNEPPYPWHVANVKHYRWKQTMARPATAIPGAYYPDERFLRIHLMKSAMPKPASYQQAIQQALQVLNTVTVPQGDQMGTDSGFGEGLADHTHYAHIYDHLNAVLYWRDSSNLQLQRIELSQMDLVLGAAVKAVEYHNSMPFFNNATAWFA
eukprot:TRINITY_DN19629_c0_g1_i1.p1 TRINITY_DN19629_c0_g1~~TRINITY_DN19629_c0_g1_i1.p1  ORF type:complete len:344 (-),score=59.14 TRINITY_DN19629_c0_g1_i1:213-1244(-)